MTENDKRLIEASIHYTIAECGRLARISTPYKIDKRTKTGVGFDHFSGRYMGFNHAHEKGGKQFRIYSHRMIYFLHHGVLPCEVDHIDGNPLNNSIPNLRSATRSQNNMNKRSHKGSSSKYLGVALVNANKKWRADISVDGKSKYLGIFTDEQDAANAYNTAAIEFHGEFANLNVIEGEKD